MVRIECIVVSHKRPLKDRPRGLFDIILTVSKTYPVDIVKSKQQADVSGEFSSAFDCIRKTQSREGIRGFYRGISTTLVRAFPVNAATFGAVEASMQLLSSL